MEYFLFILILCTDPFMEYIITMGFHSERLGYFSLLCTLNHINNQHLINETTKNDHLAKTADSDSLSVLKYSEWKTFAVCYRS